MVLLGENLGRGEHRRLAARVHHREHRAQRHHRLAGADLALKEAVHGVLGRQVVEDLAGDLRLALGEGEGQLGVEGVEQAPGHRFPRHRREPCVRVPAPGEGDLEHERLVPLEPVPGLGDIGLAVGPVDLQQGFGERDETASSRSEGGSGSTASVALGSTASRALVIFQDSKPLQAG